jgi:hypothetical protein
VILFNSPPAGGAMRPVTLTDGAAANFVVNIPADAGGATFAIFDL